MLSWTLFILHKILMIFIGYSSVCIILNTYKWYHILIVSGFLITQSIFGLCIITWLEGILRSSEGFIATSNDFILHGIIDQQFIVVFRVAFLIVGIALLFLIKRRRIISVS